MEDMVMQRIRHSMSLAIVFAVSLTMVAQGQFSRWDRQDNRQIEPLLTRIEQRAASFQNTMQRAVDQSRLDNTQKEERIDRLMADFQEAASNLRTRYFRREANDSDVRTLLDRGVGIDGFMQRRQLSTTAQTEWRLLRSDLDSLAAAYNIAWNWERDRDSYDRGGQSLVGRLTGTYRLNPSMSDNPRLDVERAVRGLPYADRQRVSEILLRRVDAPEMLSIERNGRTVTISSSRAPQSTFDADGRENIEESPSGRGTMRVVANLIGDQLTVNTSGNRGSDFNVTFDPINYGRQLRVTRRLDSERLDQPVVVQSVYDRVSDVARWDVYTGQSDYADTRPGSGDFVVPDSTLIVGRLNNDLDTNRVRAGDRFTLTVISPPEYRDAVIEGQVADANRSGRITGRAELGLNFDSIRLRSGRTGRFEGTLESVIAANGENLHVDTEGAVKQDSSQTSRTVQRAAIGTAIGAIIGAIAGGGKGAAIGAVVGGGAGAGSVYAQGRDDLQLLRGSEITIRASAPNRRASR